MNTIRETQSNNRYSARNMTKPVNFHFAAADAKSVYLSGDFNDWNPASHPMERQEEGWWFLQLSLPHGHHRYHFVVDGMTTLDPHAMGRTTNEYGEAVSLIAVS